MAGRVFKLGICQLLGGADKAKNIAEAAGAIESVATQGARMVVLPECWNSPYAVGSFREYSEVLPAVGAVGALPNSPSVTFMAEAAKKHGIYLVGGSIPEIDDDKIYNTSLTFSPSGEVIAKHRKMHLFDIDVPGKITFKESETLTAGNTFTTFETEFCKVGVGICYDIRFVEMAKLYQLEGCDLLIYPGAFNMTTGPAHWELFARARSVDCQAYTAAVSIARNPDSAYQAWGHSTVVNPWGEPIVKFDDKPNSAVVDVDLDKVAEMRTNIPTSFQRRTDLYTLEKKA